MIQILIYTSAAFISGFGIAWILRSFEMEKIKKALKSAKGYLESETLKKETLQKENVQIHQLKQIVELESTKKLADARAIIKRLDTDILLLQKSNEETESLLAAGQPALHSLKLQLIEAQNIITRYKAQSPMTSKVS